MSGVELLADPARVIARLFLPGEGLSPGHSRTTEIAARVLAVPPEQTELLAAGLFEDFSSRHLDVAAVFDRNAEAVESRVADLTTMTPAQKTVLGAAFTAEFAVEGAALCNPSAVVHPDQSGLEPGQLRVAVALRSIGEGHLSSITFAEAVIADGNWSFVERRKPLALASIGEGTWRRRHLRQALEHEGRLTELASATLGRLPASFPASEVATALTELPPELTAHRDSLFDAQELRQVAASAYEARFEPGTRLSQRVMLPATADEDHGMEDARFVRFVADDGSVEYRATYTAYNGREVAPRLITSPDLVSFSIHRLIGSGAQGKGLALFPRTVGGEHLALARSDGESISLARSTDGVVWSNAGIVHRPSEPWEIVQSGNCGSPIETPVGWIALTHGVGPMRSYAIGALLLDLDDPSRVLARTVEPLLRPAAHGRDGYVPNVVYSCGALMHDGILWIPYGIDDCRIGVFSIAVDALLDTMAPVGPGL